MAGYPYLYVVTSFSIFFSCILYPLLFFSGHRRCIFDVGAADGLAASFSGRAGGGCTTSVFGRERLLDFSVIRFITDSEHYKRIFVRLPKQGEQLTLKW